MAPPALFFPLNAIRNLLSANRGQALIASLFAVVFLIAMVWDGLETSFSAAMSSLKTDAGAGSVVLSFTHDGSSAAGDSELVFLVDFATDRDACELDSTVALSALDLALTDDDETTGSVHGSLARRFRILSIDPMGARSYPPSAAMGTGKARSLRALSRVIET